MVQLNTKPRKIDENERNSNWFEFVRLIAATKFCPSDNDFHEINRVTQVDLLRRIVPATCRSDLSPNRLVCPGLKRVL